MNEKNQLMVISSYIKDITYKMPKKAEELNARTVTAISNAVGDGIVDNRGLIWFDCNRLHTILRVRTKSDAAYILEQVDKKDKVNYNNVIYIKWTSLIAKVAERIEKNPGNEYLQLVFNLLDEINNSSDVKILQLKAKEIQQKNVKKLKKTRMKTYKIVKDELTGEKLVKSTAEFSHIRSVTMYPDISEQLWNGLIVNENTHKVITGEGVNDEEQLYSLCYRNKWSIGWYTRYKEIVKGY